MTERWFVLWIFEALSVLFSIACLAGMIVLLVTIDKQPYEQWRIVNVQLTPNTLLSILVTLAKMSLLVAVTEALGQLKWTYFQQRAHRVLDLEIFDEATRGPWGALRLLWRVRVRALVASVGAIIVILSLASDPFTQQILTYRSRTAPSLNETAYIGAATVFGRSSYVDPLYGKCKTKSIVFRR